MLLWLKIRTYVCGSDGDDPHDQYGDGGGDDADDYDDSRPWLLVKQQRKPEW